MSFERNLSLKLKFWKERVKILSSMSELYMSKIYEKKKFRTLFFFKVALNLFCREPINCFKSAIMCSINSHIEAESKVSVVTFFSRVLLWRRIVPVSVGVCRRLCVFALSLQRGLTIGEALGETGQRPRRHVLFTHVSVHFHLSSALMCVSAVTADGPPAAHLSLSSKWINTQH